MSVRRSCVHPTYKTRYRVTNWPEYDRFSGVPVTDRMGACDQHRIESRQLCWAYIERDFRALAEGPRGGRRFGRRAVKIAGDVMRAHRRFAEHGDRAAMQRELRPVWTQLVTLLAEGADSSHRKVRGISRHLIDRVEALVLFADVPGIDPTNNAAERAVRKPPGEAGRHGRFNRLSASAIVWETVRILGGQGIESEPPSGTRSRNLPPPPEPPPRTADRG